MRGLYAQKRLALWLGLMVLGLVACADGLSPTQVAQRWTEALLRADGNALRQSSCALVRVALTDEVVRGIADIVGGIPTNTTRITYTYNEIAQHVRLGGVVTVEAFGRVVDVDVAQLPFISTLPMVEQAGAWKVCPDLSAFIPRP